MFWIQNGVQFIVDNTGLDSASVKILTCHLLSFPFSGIFKRLPDSNYTLKNIYVLIVTTFYIFGVLELYSGLSTLVISSLGSYFITRYLRTSSMPWVNLVFLMGHLSYAHLHAQFFNVYDPTVIDITGAQMVMVMKLSAFGWSVYDGKQPKESLTSYTRERAIKKHPNLLPYLSYCFFYASVLAGPAFDYADYEKYITSKLFDDVPEDKRPGKRKRRIPKSGRVALYKTLQGFFWAALYTQVPKYCNSEYMFTNGWRTHSFIYRSFYLWVLSFSNRLKYYCIWLIAEGACILCGLGYNGYDSETESFRWDRVQNVDPITFETGQNFHVCLEAWNMNTNKWLKNFVYLRLARKGRKPGFKSTLVTFATSAFWHGTRPGYYLTFVMGAFCQTVGKLFRRNIRPIFVDKEGNASKYKPLYDIVCWVVTQLTFGFASLPFVLLDFKASIYCWASVYFYSIFAVMGTLVLFKGPYKKPVIDWLTSKHYHAAAQPEVQAKKTQVKLNDEESERVTNAVNAFINKNASMPTLGLPSLEEIESISHEDVDEELAEIKQAWTSFRGRRGSIAEDFEGLKNAYNNFTEEMGEIYESQRSKLKAE